MNVIYTEITMSFHECMCGRKYSTEDRSQFHNKMPCSKLHKCTLCDKLYKTPSGLKYHLHCFHKIKQDDLWLQNAIECA